MRFVVIGAQKAGTTALHGYLSEHPELWLPPEKEAPYFNKPERTHDVSALHRAHFAAAPDGAVLGKVTPQYSCHPDVAQRLARAVPDCEVLMVLRDPVVRGVSHYRMMRRRGLEQRSIDEAIATQLQARSPGDRAPAVEVDGYVAWGEYGRVLAEYVGAFGSSQVHVLDYRLLDEQPQRVVNRITDVLGVARHQPSSLGVRANVSADERRTNLREVAMRSTVLRRAFSRLPPSARARAHFSYDQWNRKEADPSGAAQPPPKLGADVLAMWQSHVAADLALIPESLRDEVGGYATAWTAESVTDER